MKGPDTSLNTHKLKQFTLFTARYLVGLGILFALYLSTALLGLKVDAISGYATLVWFPTGISLAALIIFGYRFSPAVFTAALAANYINGAPLEIAAGIATGNTLEALVAAFILKKLIGIRRDLSSLNSVLGLVIVAGVFCTAISATVGVTSLLYGGLVSDMNQYRQTWLGWWIGDFLSVIVIAPLILTWSNNSKIDFSLSKKLELFLLAEIGLVLGAVIFWDLFGLNIKSTPVTYLVFPPIIWAALRFSPREVVTGTFAFSTLAIFGTVLGYGPFTAESVSASLILLESFIAIMAITSLILTAVIEERRDFERRKDDFISIASHELNTPITSLKLLNHVMLKNLAKKRDKSDLKYALKIDEQVTRITNLVSDLLNMAKIKADSIELRKEYFSLDDLAAEVVENIQAATDKHTVKLSGKVGRNLYGDKEKIGQVLINILTNAIKYSPEGKSIYIDMQKKVKNVTVSVRDFGKGISEEDQKQIFERFFRGEKDNSLTPGLGIGLYISRNILLAHQGKIWLDSAPDKGSTFFFEIPFAKERVKRKWWGRKVTP